MKETPNRAKHYLKQLPSILITILLALTFRSFVVEPFRIPSGSMKSTLLIGDFVLVSKYSYGYSKYSLPFNIPLIKGKIFSKVPKRGDVVVFRPSKTPRLHFIKRVIGFPGDVIQVKGGILNINGTPVVNTQIEDFHEYGKSYPRFLEDLGEDKTYSILKVNDIASEDLLNSRKYRVPENKFFVMGDDRHRSNDSRFADVGFISAANIVGKAQFIVLSISDEKDIFLRKDRFFKKIK